MARSGADDRGITVAVVDGPYDRSLEAVLSRAPVPLLPGTCSEMAGSECAHGTFVVGLLAARADAAVPGLCPECPILHAPVFADSAREPVSTDELAGAIVLAVEAGAKLVNLSLAVLEDGLSPHRDLVSALDLALDAGALVVAAVGNQGRFVAGPLLSHPVVVPVAAAGEDGRMLDLSNLSPSAGRRGVLAPGQNVPGFAPGLTMTRLTGTSVAAAVATGRIARLWSAYPTIDAPRIRLALQRLRPRRGIAPPLLDTEALVVELATVAGRSSVRVGGLEPALSQRGTRVAMEASAYLQGGVEPETPAVLTHGPEFTDPPSTDGPRRAGPASRAVLAHGGGDCGCGCGGKGGGCGCGQGEAVAPPSFVFALGSIEVQFPDPSLEQEVRDAAALADITGQENSPTWLYNVLKNPGARYVARQLCYLFTVEGQPAYAIKLRDASDLDRLIAALAPGERGQDVDLVVGVRGPMAPPEMCGGVSVPILVVDQLMSFTRRELIERMPAPEDKDEAAFRDTSEAVFDRLVQIADNVGATDAHRALNFLAVRYVPLYRHVAAMEARGFQLKAVDVGVSRLSGTRRIVSPIFTFQNRDTGFLDKYFVRVDVTYEFPMIATHLQPYVDR